MKKWWEQIKEAFGSVGLIDRVLLMFMALLLGIMAVSLWDGTGVSEEAGSIDTMVRTSAAAIFGYFISGNFLKTGPSARQESPPEPKEETAPAVCCCGLQVGIVSAVGLVSLFLLLAARNGGGPRPARRRRWPSSGISRRPASDILSAAENHKKKAVQSGSVPPCRMFRCMAYRPS